MPAGTTYPNLLVEVACAFGADITSLTGSGWTWTDITDDVILEGEQGSPLNVTVGRADESSVTQTSVFKCTLDNRSGKYINTGASALWPYVRRGTPVRLRLSIDNGSTWSVRFQGTAVGFTPQWPESTGRWATVELEASGPLRVLDQGTLPAKSVYRTEIPRSPGWDGLITYWPCEGGDGIQQNPAAVPTDGKPPIELDLAYFPKATNNPSNAAFPLSGPYQSHMKMGTRTAIPAYTNTGILQVRMMVAVPGKFPVAQWQPFFYMDTTNAAVPTWSLQVNEAGDLRLVGYNASDVIVKTLGPIAFNSNGTSRLTAVIFDNNGTGLDTEIRTVDQTGDDAFFNQSFASTNIGTLTQVEVIGPDFSDGGTGTENALVTHVTVQNTATNISTASVIDLWLGLPGEAVTTRLVRVANLHGMNVDLMSPGVGAIPAYTETANSITLAAGPQYYDTLSGILRELETTGQGLLYDGLGTGLTYVSRRYRQQRAVAATLTLDASSGHLTEPFGPVDDDQVLFNHYTVNRHNGTHGAEYFDVTGSEGTNIVGDHANSLTVNCNVDAGLVGYAQWGVNTGTISGYRFPQIGFALHTNASLIPQWLACTPQSRIDITNIAAVRRQLSPDPIWLLLEGWTETISMFEWNVQANTSSAEPWNVIRLAAATGSTGDDICHMDTDSSQLNTSAALGATSISVRTNSGPLWVQSSADADSFPFYITVGGLRVQVTAISGAASPQTFTLASPGLAAAKTGSTTPGAGAPINIWRPPVLGL
jgi:hypothetical protein